MKTSNMKNILVLKELPSNIVEEAIVFIKPNVKIKNPEHIENKAKNDGKFDHDKGGQNEKEYVIKEAQMLISNYISNIENPKDRMKNTNRLLRKCENYKKLSIFLGLIILFNILINLI